jgi:hypothetical protein
VQIEMRFDGNSGLAGLLCSSCRCCRMKALNDVMLGLAMSAGEGSVGAHD